MRPIPAVEPRARLNALAADRGVALSSLSRMIGRNVAYLQQFVRRGTPKRLDERDRRLLAQFFDVPELDLGGPLPDPIVRRPAPDALVDVVAAEMWDAKAGDEGPTWVDASDHWQRAYRDQATLAIEAVRKHDRAA